MQNINLKKLLFLSCTLLIFIHVKIAFCQENTSSPNPVSINNETVNKNEKQEETVNANIWRKILGIKSRDALLLGMWSIHLKGGSGNEQNHLIGIQYYGLTAGTFMNSHNERAWFFGFTREVFSREITENTRLDLGYKLGPLYGYGEDLPNIFGISLAVAGTIGIS